MGQVPLLSYALKRIVRSWRLFAALMLGMILAATFFGGINVGADTIGKQALERQLANTPVDIKLTPDYSFGGFGSTTVSASTFQTVATEVMQVDGVKSAEPRGQTGLSGTNITGTLRAIPDGSFLYQHMTTISGQKPQATNETLVSANSEIANKYPIGTVLEYQFSSYGPPNPTISLKIVGVAVLDTLAASTLGTGVFFESGSVTVTSPQQSVLIVSWEKTFSRIVDWAFQQSQQVPPRPVYDINAYVDVNLDRDQFVSPFDVQGSAERVRQVDARVSNIAAQYRFSSTDNLTPQLEGFAPAMFTLRFSFTIFSIPVFFMAWYVGRTVSQASYNLRRREIGLLMTKGFSRTQLFRHFLVEALIVGLISGIIGLALAFALNPFFVQALSGTFQGSVFLSRESAIITLIFTLFLTFLSILSPAREASSMDPAQALREYVYIEDIRASKKRGAIIAFSLGLYKMILLILGINFATIGRYAVTGGFLLALVLLIMAVIDFGLTFIGPFLFLYGATQLSTGLSIRFHKAFSAISIRLVGDIASLASKNVFRNPRRAASLVFLVSLIAGYSIWVTGDLASMEDFNIRQAKVRVGSDIRISNLSSLSNATAVANQLSAWDNITAMTIEAETQFNLPSLGYSIRVKAIDPATWRDGAYYEPEWFTGDLNSIFQVLASDNTTIVLDKGLASYFSIRPGGTFTISQNPTPLTLQVIGFFGPDYSGTYSLGIVTPGFSYFYPQGWSYVPLNLVVQYPSLFSTSSVLLKAKPGVLLTDLSKSIQRAYPYGFAEVGQPSTQDSSAVVFGGILNVLRLGTVFAAAAACIGVGAVAYTGFKEREKETTMIAVRGLSYRQLLGLLVTEVLPLVIFALILATVVGLITVRGDTLALNAVNPTDIYTLLAPRRIVFPYWSQVTLLTIVGLLLLGVFVPALLSARKDLSKMSRTVRFA